MKDSLREKFQAIRSFLDKRAVWFYYLLILLLIITGYLAFYYREGFLLFGDFNPAVSKDQFLYAWSGKNLGYDYSSYLTPFFYGLLSYCLTFVFGLNVGTQISFILPILYFISVIFWSSYKLFNTKPKFVFLISLFAIFNPITLGYIYHGGVDITFFGFANILLCIVFLYKFFQQETADYRYMAASVLFAAFAISLVYFFILCVLLALYFFFELFFQKRKMKFVLQFGVFFFLVFLINSYWLIPFANSLLFQNAQGLVLSNDAGISVLNSLKPFATVINDLSLYYYGALQERFNFGLFLDFSLVSYVTVLLYLLLVKKDRAFDADKKKQKLLLLSLVVFLLSLFFAVGPNPPFGTLFIALFKYVPFFQGFRTYIRFSVVIFICYLIFTNLSYAKFKADKKVESLLSLILLILIGYFGYHYRYLATSNVFPQSLPKEYQEYVSNPDQDDSLASDAPFYVYNQGHTWGDSSIITHLKDRFFWYGYTGYLENDDIRSYLVKMVDDNRTVSVSSRYFGNLASILNLNSFIFHKDKYADSKSISDKSINLFNRLVSDKAVVLMQDNPYFSVYKMDPKYHLPHFYIPKTLSSVSGGVESLSNLLLDKKYQIGDAVFLTKQNQGKEAQLDKWSGYSKGQAVIEYKKINPAKYRIILHQATGQLPVVFSESFQSGWKLYQSRSTESDVKADPKTDELLKSYRVFANNSETQATKEELAEYISSGYIGNLSTGRDQYSQTSVPIEGIFTKKQESHKIGYISKNLFSTIQNDNLKNGNILETVLLRPLPESNHLVANGYANSWTIDVQKICQDNKSCTKNADGSYDLELIAEFLPQKLFLAGLAVTIVLGLSLLIIALRRRKK